MLFRDWRVGYSQQFDSSIDSSDWVWNSYIDEAKALHKFTQYETSHFNKKSMSMLVLMAVEWDTETKESKCSILKSLHGKLTSVIHYNKKDVPNGPKLYSQEFVVPVAPISPPQGGAGFSDHQLLSVFLNHMNN